MDKKQLQMSLYKLLAFVSDNLTQLSTWEPLPIECLWWTTDLQSTVHSSTRFYNHTVMSNPENRCLYYCYERCTLSLIHSWFWLCAHRAELIITFGHRSNDWAIMSLDHPFFVPDEQIWPVTIKPAGDELKMQWRISNKSWTQCSKNGKSNTKGIYHGCDVTSMPRETTWSFCIMQYVGSMKLVSWSQPFTHTFRRGSGSLQYMKLYQYRWNA